VQKDADSPARRLYRVYGEEATGDENERDTDVTALADRQVAVTPLHFDLTHHAGVQALIEHDLARLLEEPTGKQP